MRFRPLLAAALLALGLPATADAHRHHHRHHAHHHHGHHHHAPSPRHATARAAEHCPDADLVPAPGNLTRVRAAIVCLHNEIRASHGLARLDENRRLRHAAAGHSFDMVRGGYFDHTTPGGVTMVDRIKHSGFVRPDRAWVIGENLEWGTGGLSTPRGAMDAWMKSPDHRENILDRGYREVGVGVSLGTPEDGSEPGATYTVDFGAIG